MNITVVFKGLPSKKDFLKLMSEVFDKAKRSDRPVYQYFVLKSLHVIEGDQGEKE